MPTPREALLSAAQLLRPAFVAASRRQRLEQAVGRIRVAVEDVFAVLGLPKPQRGQSPQAGQLLHGLAVMYEAPVGEAPILITLANAFIDFVVAQGEVLRPLTGQVQLGTFTPQLLAGAVRAAMDAAAVSAALPHRFACDFDVAAPRKFRIQAAAAFNFRLRWSGGPSDGKLIAARLGWPPVVTVVATAHVAPNAVPQAFAQWVVPAAFWTSLGAAAGSEFDSEVARVANYLDKPLVADPDIAEG